MTGAGRLAALVGGIWLGLIAATGAGLLALASDPLGSVLGVATGASFTAREDGSVEVTAPAGTPVLALATGRVASPAGDVIEVHGEGPDAGLVVTYGAVEVAAPLSTVTRGAAIGAIPRSGHVEVSATVDGVAIDVAPRLSDVPDTGGGALASAPPSTMTRPVDGAVISQQFGCTDFAAEPVDPGCPGGHVHSGIDLATPSGTPVHAALSGQVHVVRTRGGYGLRVELTHAGGLLTLYGHLESSTVADGDTVVAGEVIGRVGSTGNSTGPHLHFEVRRGGAPEDPRIDVPLP